MDVNYLISILKSNINKKNILKAIQIVFVLLFLIPLYNYSTSVAFGIDYFSYNEVKPSSLKISHQNSFFADIGDEKMAIDINWIYGDIEISQYQGEVSDPIVVEEYSDVKLDKAHQMNAVYDARKLTIKWASNDFYSENTDAFQTKKLVISIPSALGISSCRINTEITKIEFSDITTSEFALSAKSADIKMHNSNIGDLNIGIDEGDVDLKSVLCDMIYINSGNAPVNATNVSTEKIYFQSNTGNLSYIGNSEYFNAKTVYGDVSIKSYSTVKSIILENLFGKTTAKIPDTANFVYTELNFEGEIELDGFDIQTVLNEKDEPELYYYVREDSSNSYTLSTTLGTVNVSKVGVHQDFDTYSEWQKALALQKEQADEEPQEGEQPTVTE